MTNLSISDIIARTINFAKWRSEQFDISIYAPITKNVYYDGSSYRVRVTRDYNRTSKNFKRIKDAIEFRNKLVSHQ